MWAIISFLFFFFCSMTILPQSKWIWQNPQPQGNYYGKINVFNDTWFAVTQMDILKSTNQGADWKYMYHSDGAKGYLDDIYFINENTGYALEGGAHLLKTTDGGINWTQVSTFTFDVNKCNFLNETTGYIFRLKFPYPSSLYRTTDGGITWSQNLITFSSQAIYDISFAGDSTFWINDASFIPDSNGGYIDEYHLYKTTDQGNSWIQQSAPNAELQLSFFSADSGYIFSFNHLFFTSDGGNTWIQLPDVLRQTPGSAIFFNGSTGYFLLKKIIYKTSNGGQSWNIIHQADFYLFETFFVNEKNVIFTGLDGYLLYTTDGGLTWNSHYKKQIPDNILSIYFSDPRYGWAAGKNNGLFKTADSGYTWQQVNVSSLQQDFQSVVFFNKNTGYVGGKMLYKTTDGGLNWNSVLTPQGGIYNLQFLTPEVGFAMEFYNNLWITTDGGTHWLNRTFPSVSFARMFFTDLNTGFIAGEGKLLRTTDGGLNWTTQYQNYKFSDVFFVDQKYGWVMADGITQFRTTDGGKNWMQVNTRHLFYPNIYFKDINNGWATDENALIFTTNGGVTWSDREEYTYSFLYDICGTGNSVWAAGQFGSILRNSDFYVPVELVKNSPGEFALFECYPIPFNSGTKIKFSIPSQQMVEIKIYNVLGKEVAVLVKEELPPGTYEREWNAANKASGVYYYRIITGNYNASKKMIYLK